MGKRTWENIRELDRKPVGARFMLLFLGESLYFQLLLSADYKEPLFICTVSALTMMVFLLGVMVSYTRWEKEHWRSMYEKIRYFPVDRKKYLLAIAVSAGKIFGFQLGMQVFGFLCRMLIRQEIAPGTAGGILLCTAVSGIWFFLSFLGLLAAGERALFLFPAFLSGGMAITTGLCRILY